MNPNRTLHLLVVEDNAADVDLVKVLLKESSVKYELYVANSLFEGVQLVKEKEIGMVLLDLSLPDSTGFKTLTSFIERCPNVPVIVMTGTNNELIGNQAVKAGAQDYLVKGHFDSKLLGRSIRYSLHRIKSQIKLEATAKHLAISEKRYVEAQEMAHFGNWEMDIVSNQMKWTDEIFRIFGFHPNNISPSLSDYIQYTHPEDKPAVQQFFEAAARDGQLHTLDHRIIIKGRSIRYVVTQAKVQFEPLSEKILLVGAIQDITQQKLNEQLIVEKNINSKAGKIKDEALADISFHIRTPLSSVMNLLYLMERTEISEQQEELMTDLKTSVDDLSIMVNNLLNFSVLVADKLSLEYETFVIGDFLESMKRVIKIRTDNANINLDFSVASTLPKELISDTKKMTQVLYNLVDYLIEKTTSNKNLLIKVDTNEIAGRRALEFSMQSEDLYLDEEQIKDLRAAEKLLEIYAPEEDEARRSMIGMAIVSKLIDLLHGQLAIESTEDQGTTFRITLPVEIAEKKLIQHGDKPESPLRILLVEDHFLNQIATKKVLAAWTDQVTVDIAENGQIGVDKFRAIGYDLILMDIQMPVMNGFDAAKEIRKQSSVPIIALTANASKVEEDKCLSVGINDYLSKPFKPQDLYTKIMSTLVAVQS